MLQTGSALDNFPLGLFNSHDKPEVNNMNCSYKQFILDTPLRGYPQAVHNYIITIITTN